VSDFADEAKVREEAELAAVLTAFKARPKPSGVSAYFCRSCGERIEEKRRDAVPGTNVCAFCARQLTGPK